MTTDPEHWAEDTAVLNHWDRELLKRHLKGYRKLHEGTAEIRTPAREHFLRVCHGLAKPRTQHEIAYTRYLRWRAQAHACISDTTAVEQSDLEIPDIPITREMVPATAFSEELARAVEDIEDALVLTPEGSARGSFLGGVRDWYQRQWKTTRTASAEAALWVTTALSAPEFAGRISSWAGEEFNTLSNSVTRAMDGSFAEGLLSGASYVAPVEHRLFGGHTLPEAIEAARNAMPGASDAEVAWEAFRALASDVTSPAGLPLLTFSKAGFDQVASIAGTIGIDRSMLTDWVTFNAVEILATAVPAVALLLNWTAEDRKLFWRTLGACGVGAAASANPLLLVLVVVAGALDFHLQVRGQADRGSIARAVSEGGILSGIILAASAAIGGPVWVGVVAGLILAMAMRGHLTDMDIGRMLARLKREAGERDSPLPE